MIIERNVLVPTRHGDPIAVDVFRPDDDGPHPVIATMSPYGKGVHWPHRFPLYDETDQGPDAVWETPYPGWWVPRGYALVRADSPGTGASSGVLDLLGEQEVDGYYDVIEWAGSRPWSNGKVGALGISWLAMLQWRVAEKNPPHLAAMIPWEGCVDAYRELARHGGILSDQFIEFWWDKQIEPQRHDRSAITVTAEPVRELLIQMKQREFLDEWYEQRTPRVEAITVPFLAAGNWGSLVVHQRGVVEAFTSAASPTKQLIITAGTHIGPFYEDWAKQRQLRFLDRWLRGELNGAEHDPRVTLAIRAPDGIRWRDEQEWPLARTQWLPLFLDVAQHTLTERPAPTPSKRTQHARGPGVEFSIEFDREMEFTGPATLRLWIASSARDADIFVRLHVRRPDGTVVSGIGPQGAPIPLAMGWLRASHRALDPELSVPYRPVHTHRREELLRPNDPVALDIEIWPTSIVLPIGHSLVLEVRGNDSDLGVISHSEVARSVTSGDSTITIITGGTFESRLLLPLIPGSAREAPAAD